MAILLINLFPRFDKRTVLLHLGCWSIFITYELCFLYYALQKFFASSIISFLLYYAVNICIFYSTLYLLNRSFHKKEAMLKNLLFFLLLFAFFMLTKAVLDVLLAAPAQSVAEMLHTAGKRVYYNAFRGVYFCALSIFFWVAGNIAGYRKKAALSERNQLIAQKEKAQLETRLSETRNAYLQQQLNPHLLFNALSFIYSSVYPHSADASRCVLLLSEIMRYSLEGAGSDGKMLLTRELEQIENLVEINRYRFDRELYLQTSLQAGKAGLRIIPLVLLTLTENLFKHGLLTDPAHPALLEVRADAEGSVTYLSRNRKKAKSGTLRTNSLGLQHTRIRLEHSYPGAYRLDIREDDDFYELQLTLLL